jgi:hypothetical protein
MTDTDTDTVLIKAMKFHFFFGSHRCPIRFFESPFFYDMLSLLILIPSIKRRTRATFSSNKHAHNCNLLEFHGRHCRAKLCECLLSNGNGSFLNRFCDRLGEQQSSLNQNQVSRAGYSLDPFACSTNTFAFVASKEGVLSFRLAGFFFLFSIVTLAKSGPSPSPPQIQTVAA